MKEEVHELQEHAEQGQHDSALAPASLTMAILAVLVAAASLLGHRAHTEELLLQTQATDKWAYYQAKNIRRHNYELFLDLLSTSSAPVTERAAEVKRKYQREIERYDEDKKEIKNQAEEVEKERDLQRRKADRFDLGEGFLEVALVITSITLLTRRRVFWYLGIVIGLAGVAVTLSGLRLH
ncbi:MAG: DUF4337 domain-containing protein [Acidobacteria bacterium]|nr:MAG: DUF4337 domain-containing protein [Acidobacteriota bacterium]